MAPIVHPGRLLKRELAAREVECKSPFARHRRSFRPHHGYPQRPPVNYGRYGGANPGRYFGNSPQFWLDLQGQHDIGTGGEGKGRGDRQARQARRCCLRAGPVGPLL